MACYHPIPGWYSRRINETGRRSITFKLADGYADRPVSVPCGSCIGCQLEKARRWAVRCMHEASLWEENCFLTLTYDEEHVPWVPGPFSEKDYQSLRPADMVNFLKRLRAKYGAGIRFFQCGEYGDKLQRPHHHVLLFNFRFADMVPLRGEDKLYTSAELARLWPYGFSTIGEVSFQSAGYVARYALKKVRGVAAEAHYHGKEPEYLTMSRRPGIGRGWLDKYLLDVYPRDEMVVNGVVMRPPRYYDDLVARYSPGLMAGIRAKRAREAEEKGSTGRELIVEEVIKEASIRTLNRGLEAGND